ncbi:MAG: hypothetical protein ABI656_04015 [bacterium]
MMRNQVIKDRMAQQTEKVSDTAVVLWGQIAVHIISIIGEGGFNSLYARSVFLTQSTYPWLADGTLATQADHQFAELKRCLEIKPEEARAANCLLLITFTDILASLIGEQLTSNILRSAWGMEPSNSAVEESKNA